MEILFIMLFCIIGFIIKTVIDNKAAEEKYKNIHVIESKGIDYQKQLESIPMQELEKFLRKMKLNKINKNKK